MLTTTIVTHTDARKWHTTHTDTWKQAKDRLLEKSTYSMVQLFSHRQTEYANAGAFKPYNFDGQTTSNTVKNFWFDKQFHEIFFIKNWVSHRIYTKQQKSLLKCELFLYVFFPQLKYFE